MSSQKSIYHFSNTFKGSMDKDEVLKKLRSDLFESGNSPAKAEDPRRKSPPSNPYAPPASPPSPAFQKDEPRRKEYRDLVINVSSNPTP